MESFKRRKHNQSSTMTKDTKNSNDNHSTKTHLSHLYYLDEDAKIKSHQYSIVDKCKTKNIHTQCQRSTVDNKQQIITYQTNLPQNTVPLGIEVFGPNQRVNFNSLFLHGKINLHHSYTYKVPKNREGKVKRRAKKKRRQSSYYRPKLFKPSLQPVQEIESDCKYNMDFDGNESLSDGIYASEFDSGFDEGSFRSGNRWEYHNFPEDTKQNLIINAPISHSLIIQDEVDEISTHSICAKVGGEPQWMTYLIMKQVLDVLPQKIEETNNISERYSEWFRYHKIEIQYYDKYKMFTGDFTQDLFRAVKARNIHMLRLVTQVMNGITLGQNEVSAQNSMSEKLEKYLLSLRNFNGHNFLMECVRNGWITGTKFFVTNGWEVNTILLHIALRYRHLEIYRYLIDQKHRFENKCSDNTQRMTHRAYCICTAAQ